MYADRILTVFCARDFACPAQLSSQAQQLKDAGEKCERLEQAQKDLQRQHKHVQEQLTAGVSSRAPFAFL